MRKQRAGSFVIRAVVILLVLAMGVVILLALLPPLFSASVSYGPRTTDRCSTSYVAIKNTGLLAFTLGEWEVKHEATGYVYRLPDQILLPGQAIRVWSASGENDAHNLYAGRMEQEWEVNGLVVHGKSPVGEIYASENCD